MKRLYSILSLIAFVLTAAGQTTDDALRLSLARPSGTARSMSLGNAMGALGGDFTSLSINPAGIAVYRSSEFAFTPALHLNQSSTNYYDNTGEDEKLKLSIQQIGYVGTFKPVREVSSGIVSTHFAIGYNRNNSFNRNSYFMANGVQSSLMDEVVYFADNLAPSSLQSRQRLFYDAYLIDPMAEQDENTTIPSAYYHAFEDIDEEGPFWPLRHGINQRRLIEEQGNAGEFVFSGGLNISNMLYLGASLGIATDSYQRTLNHYEQVNPNNTDWDYLDHYTLTEELRSNAIGANLKVGIIYKPINAIRIATAVHLPTFYSVDEEYAYSVDLPNGFADYQNYYTPQYEFSYNFTTPFKFVQSVGFIFGNKGLLSADYEFTDYSSMKFKAKGTNLGIRDDLSFFNQQIDDTFRGSHNLRIGAEIKPTEVLSLRGGWGILTSPYQSNFLNSDDTHFTYSLGMGFRMNNMFVDLGYMLRQEKSTYSLYYSAADYMSDEDQEPANLKYNNHQVALTLGWRF